MPIRGLSEIISLAATVCRSLCGIGNKHLPEPWALHWFCNLTSLMYKACSCGVGRQAAVRTLPQQPSNDRMIQKELFIWGACYSTVGWWKLISTVPMHFEGQTPWYCWHDAILLLSRMTLLHQDIIGLSVSSASWVSVYGQTTQTLLFSHACSWCHNTKLYEILV